MTTDVSDPLVPIDTTGIPAAHLLAWLHGMELIREFEDVVEPLALQGEIPGGAHLAIGQEAVAVGCASALDTRDKLACSHRAHHHSLAKGLGVREAMAELFGKATGCCGGRGGTMHMADMSIGLVGGNGIVGAAVGLGAGLALGAQLRGDGAIAVAVMGDGGLNTGRTWEAVNLAAAWQLPLVIVCENNRYAVATSISRMMPAGSSGAARAAAFGMAARTVDGQDVAAVHRAVGEARTRALAGQGPTFIEAMTYRYGPHNTGENTDYRTEEEPAHWRRTRDPVERLARALQDAGELDKDDREAITARARQEVQEAVAFARSSPFPDAATAAHGVYSAALEQTGQAPVPAGGAA